MIDFRIDYIQYNIDPHESNIYKDIVGQPRQPAHNRWYRYKSITAGGAIILEGNVASDKALHILAGKACDYYNVTPQKLTALVNKKASVSRIDLTLTTDKPILEKIKADRDKIVSEQFQGMKTIENPDNGIETIYIGDMKKRGRKGIVRAYDKALELGLESMILHRLELELKRDDAMLATKRLAIGASIPSVMNSKFSIDTDWYRELFSDEIATSRFTSDDKSHIEEEIERKMLWIMKQVIPSLQYVIDYDIQNGTNNFATILEKLNFDGSQLVDGKKQ